MRLRTCLLAAALIIASGTTGWVYLHSFRSPREALLAAIKGSRPTEARLGGAGFAPYDLRARPGPLSAGAPHAGWPPPRQPPPPTRRPARGGRLRPLRHRRQSLASFRSSPSSRTAHRGHGAE